MDPVRFRLRISLFIFLGTMVLGTIGFIAIEGTSVVDAFYFVIVTMATVGYGDVHPVTPAGKFFVVFLIILGVGTFLGVIANATEMMLEKKIKQTRLDKLNLMIGVFFSEVGTKLIGFFTDYDPDLNTMRESLLVTGEWTDQQFLKVRKDLKTYKYAVEIQREQLGDLGNFLLHKRDFLLRLLENPVLLEHETFTELLRAVFHLVEELACREDFIQVPESDRRHLAGDIKRVYQMLVNEWLAYMKYLKKNYPYLFSLAMRMNPFNPKASPIVLT